MNPFPVIFRKAVHTQLFLQGFYRLEEQVAIVLVDRGRIAAAAGD